MKKLALIAVVFLLAVISWFLLPIDFRQQLDERLGVHVSWLNREGVTHLQSGDVTQALAKWSEALTVSPQDTRLHYNVGTGLQILNKGEDAESSYNVVLKSSQASLQERFACEFNMGVMAQAAKDVDRALQHYQAALDLAPDSRETKINIELLIQQGGGGGQGDQNKDQKGQGKKDQEQDGQGDKDKDNKPKEYAKNPPPQKPKFKSEELTPSDVNKILGELKQQEQRIRAEFNRKESKEQKGDKDW